MELITIEAFADMIMQNNPTIQRRQLVLRLHTALSHKNTGVTCACCGEPIWAAGSALVGSHLCFVVLQESLKRRTIMKSKIPTSLF